MLRMYTPQQRPQNSTESAVNTAQNPYAKIPILENKARMFRRPNSKFWWVGFIHQRREVASSTKQTEFEPAKKVAIDWYLKRYNEVTNGFAPAKRGHSFSVAMDKALEQYSEDAKRGIRSDAYIKEIGITMRVLKTTCIANVDIANVDQGVWNAVRKELLKAKPNRTEATLHQYKNVINITLNEALRRHEIKQIPPFAKEKKKGTNDADTQRTWFTPDEYNKLRGALAEYIDQQKSLESRWIEDAEELRDYVGFVANTGLRIGEAKNVRFCDVTIVYDKNVKMHYLEIRNIKGKRGEHGDCRSYYVADHYFRRCIKRHALTLENYKQSEAKIFKAYHRDMFRQVLRNCDLYLTKDRRPRKRDLMSLRHTYICFRLLMNAPIYDIAANCRTSVQMIQQHYARHLSVFQSKAINGSPWGETEQ